TKRRLPTTRCDRSALSARCQVWEARRALDTCRPGSGPESQPLPPAELLERIERQAMTVGVGKTSSACTSIYRRPCTVNSAGFCCTSPGEKRLLLKHQQGVC